MSKKLENKVVIITGASKGIGAGIAKKMGAEGARVIVNYASDKEGADIIVAGIVQDGGTAIAMQGDMSKPADVTKLFEQTKKAYGSLDVLVNNAGIYEFALLAGVTEESYRRIFDINVLGAVLTSQEAIKLFDPKKGGSIINISSFASRNPEPYSVIYAASKSAINSVTSSLSQELGAKNIRVNAVLPGGILTEGVAKLGITDEADSIRQMAARTALGRMGTPADIANVVAFLASDEAYFVTGQTIEVSGGFK